MSNAELNGSQIPGSADEKVRRSTEAFYEFNEERAALLKAYKVPWATLQQLSVIR